MTLQEALVWIVSGGGAAWLTYVLMERAPQLKRLRPDQKRYASIGLAIGLAAAAWGAMVLLGFETMPETLEAWADGIFRVAVVALGVSQGAHGVLKLRPAKEEHDV